MAIYETFFLNYGKPLTIKRPPHHFFAFPGKPKQTGWPGTLAYNLDPPDWARREIRPLSEYVDYADKNRWTRQWRAKVTGRQTDPIQLLERLTKAASTALESLLSLTSSVPAAVRSEIDLLTDSARISYLTGEKWTRLLTARLLYAGAKGPNPTEQQKELAQQAIDQYQLGLEATEKMVPVFERFPNTLCDPSMTLTSLKSEVDKRRRELEFLEEDLALAGDSGS